MSNLEYVDLDYGVRMGYETQGEGLDGEHDVRIYQFPHHKSLSGYEDPEDVRFEWPYGGTPSADPDYTKDLIMMALFDLHVSEKLPDEPTSIWFVKMEDPYTIRMWQA